MQVTNVCSYKLGQKINFNFVQTRLVFAWTVTYVTVTYIMYQHIINPNQKHPWCKKSCGQELEKGLDEKEVKSKMGGQGLCSASYN